MHSSCSRRGGIKLSCHPMNTECFETVSCISPYTWPSRGWRHFIQRREFRIIRWWEEIIVNLLACARLQAISFLKVLSSERTYRRTRIILVQAPRRSLKGIFWAIFHRQTRAEVATGGAWISRQSRTVLAIRLGWTSESCQICYPLPSSKCGVELGTPGHLQEFRSSTQIKLAIKDTRRLIAPW